MKKSIVAALLVLGTSVPVLAQYCPSCVQNSAIPSSAVFNVSSATVRGQFSVGTLVAATLNLGTVTAGTFTGDGSHLTVLNAAALSSGTVPSARIAGAYPSITGIGALSAGGWNASIIGSQYGGTGANLITAGTGSVPYFSAVGTMAALAPTTAGYVMQTNGASSAPSWTGAPQVLGTNVTAIPLANVTPGNIPMSWALNDASISTVSAAKVVGNISGNAANITGTLALSSLAAGAFNTSNPASSVTASGVVPGIWGGPSLLIQAYVGSDGRITSISQSSFTVNVGSITAGALPIGVTITPAQIVTGSLGASVIASSLNATGVVAGAYGLPSQVSSFTVTTDGRLHLAGQVPIAINTSQINNGALPPGVTVPPANLTAGALPNNVIASSVAVSGIPAGTYGAPGYSLQVHFGADGRATAASSYEIPGVATTTALADIDNNWAHAQTSQSSWTINAPIKATSFAGDGSGLINLAPSQMNAGTFNSNVVASSVSIPFLTVTSSVNASAFFGDGSHLTGTLNTGVYNVFTASQQFNAGGGIGVKYGIATATMVATGNVAAGSFSGPLTGDVTGNVSGSAGTIAASGINAGSLGSSVIASSIAVSAVGTAQIAAQAVTATTIADATITNTQLASGSFGAITALPSLTSIGSALTSASSITVQGQLGILVTSSVTAKTFIGDGSNLTGVATNKFGFLSGNNGTLGVGTFSFGYTNAAVVLSSMSVIITVQGSGGTVGTRWSCCYGGSCVHATSSAGAAIGSTYTGNGAVSVPAGGQIVLEIESTDESITPTANTICGYQ